MENFIVQLNFSMSFEASGNLSSGLPFFSETSGCSFSLFETSWLLATRATLLALLVGISTGLVTSRSTESAYTAFVLIFSCSMAFDGSSPPATEGAADGAADPALDGVAEALLASFACFSA